MIGGGNVLRLQGTSKNLGPASSALCADPSGKRSRSVILRCSSVSYLQVTSFRRTLADPNDKRLCHRFEVLRGTLKTNGAYTSAYAGAFLAYDNADHTIGAEGISYGGTLESIGLWGETSGTAAKSYGVFGKATAPNSWAGWFEGNVMINGNGFLTGMIPITSDANLKTNVQALTNASEFLDQLLPKTYDFLVDEHPEIALPSGPQMGFIAQDVELILPQLVKQATIPATKRGMMPM